MDQDEIDYLHKKEMEKQELFTPLQKQIDKKVHADIANLVRPIVELAYKIKKISGKGFEEYVAGIIASVAMSCTNNNIDKATYLINKAAKIIADIDKELNIR